MGGQLLSRQENTGLCKRCPIRTKPQHEGADSRNRRPAVLSAGHSRRRGRYHRRRDRHQQAHALQPLPVQGCVDSGLSRTPLPPSPPSDKPPAEQISRTFDRLERGLPARVFAAARSSMRWLNSAPAMRSSTRSRSPSRKAAALWFRDLLKQLERRRCGGARDPAHATGRRRHCAGSGAQRSLDGPCRQGGRAGVAGACGDRGWRAGRCDKTSPACQEACVHPHCNHSRTRVTPHNNCDRSLRPQRTG